MHIPPFSGFSLHFLQPIEADLETPLARLTPAGGVEPPHDFPTGAGRERGENAGGLGAPLQGFLEIGGNLRLDGSCVGLERHAQRVTSAEATRPPHSAVYEEAVRTAAPGGAGEHTS